MVAFPCQLFIWEVALALVGTEAVRVTGRVQLTELASTDAAIAEKPMRTSHLLMTGQSMGNLSRRDVAVTPLSSVLTVEGLSTFPSRLWQWLWPTESMTLKYGCGEVPREVLLQKGLIPREWEHLRCPRGQSGDDLVFGDSRIPTEQEFLACGLVSTRKFVVWTPHSIIKSDPKLAALFSWARQHTTCDFSLADKCNAGFLLHHGSAESSSSMRCLPPFDITAQPTPRHVLVDIAIKLFHATSEMRGLEGLSYEEAEMAFGAVLGYPKYSTRDYMGNHLDDFDKSYERAVSWILDQLEGCCMDTDLYKNLAAWPDTTNRRAPLLPRKVIG